MWLVSGITWQAFQTSGEKVHAAPITSLGRISLTSHGAGGTLQEYVPGKCFGCNGVHCQVSCMEVHLISAIVLRGRMQVAVLHQQLHQPLLQPQHRPYAVHRKCQSRNH